MEETNREKNGNKKRGALGGVLFVVLFFLVMLYPLVGGKLFPYVTLSGVTAEADPVSLSKGPLWEGTYQTGLNTWWENHFPGRSVLIKIRGQLLYSLLGESPNENVVIGKEDTLFEPGFIFRELAIDGATWDPYFEELENKLIRLNDIVKAKGKELYLFLTPNKVHYFRDRVPARYQVLQTREGNNYTKFVNLLERNDLLYFDSHAYLETLPEGTFQAPLFYRTGTHWSGSYGYACAAAFADYISETSPNWDLGKLTVWEEPVSVPQFPDTDLYDSLNIIKDPTEQYYTAGIRMTEEGDHPVVFFRGGSFMGQSLNGLCEAGVFPSYMHLENNYYHSAAPDDSGVLSAYTAYDELDLASYLKRTDLLILEVNEAIISSMSFGFIDYLLDHEEVWN